MRWAGETAWASAAGEVEKDLQTSARDGLQESTVEERRRHFGPNRKSEVRAESAALIFIRQFRSLIVILLLVAAFLSFLLRDVAETIAILIVILINSQIGFWTELKGRRSMEALLRLGHVPARVIRAGRAMQIDAEELVPGDLVVLEGGDIVSADLRLFQASNVEVNEASLTGESLPVSKSPDPLPAETLLHDRENMLFQGTFVVRGSARGIVVSTGDHTEIGHISQMVTKAKESLTPLERRLEALGRRLIVITLFIAAIILLIGFLRGHDPIRMLETSIALAVAAIPEGLPVVATIALASGMRLMARKNAIITRLSSVETLGATGIICTDKTGTLTENRMEARWLVTEPGEPALDLYSPMEGVETSTEDARPDVRSGVRSDMWPEARPDPLPIDRPDDRSAEKASTRPILCMALCNNATWDSSEEKGIGDPTEIALVKAVERRGVEAEALRHAHPRTKEIPFDSETKRMATWNRDPDGGATLWVKGAPSEILSVCVTLATGAEEHPMDDARRSRWEASVQAYASQGFRLIALASGRGSDTTSPDESDPFHDLTFLGFVALSDPPRTDVKEAIGLCRQAGINVVMLTGDQPETARYVAQEVGLVEKAPVTPEQTMGAGRSGRGEVPEGSDRVSEGGLRPHSLGVIHGRDLPDLQEIESRPAVMEELSETPIFARITPRQKLDLIEFYQNRGAVVAMTGDGVNDAPALKKADIGIAMGQRGTQVAMDASDMVLRDDAFSTIVTAIRHGRIIYNNIRQFILYLMSCNMSEILVVASLTAFGVWLNDHLFHSTGMSTLSGTDIDGLALMLTPLQILFLNLVTDVFPALALGVGRGDASVMKEKPRHKTEQILSPGHWGKILTFGLMLTLLTFGAVILRGWISPISPDHAMSLLFYSLAFGQLLHVFNMRRASESILGNGVTRNPWVWGALLLCSILLLSIQWVPTLRDVLNVGAMDTASWLVLILSGGGVLLLGQWIASLGSRTSGSNGTNGKNG